MKPIAILGSGPAGLLAAHTIGGAMPGTPLVLLSKPVKSHLSGAQFLHEPIPGITGDKPDVMITYRLRGDALSYRKKVYGEGEGPMLPGFVSFENISDGLEQPAWNLVSVYDKLWDFLGSSVRDADISPQWLHDNQHHFRAIISSIPLPALCCTINPIKVDGEYQTPSNVHFFSSQDIWLQDENIIDMPDNTVYYNGDLSQSWYRSSRLFGLGGTEWSQQGRKPPLPNLLYGSKPVANTCDCWPNVIRVGRFGKWQKGVLTHHAMHDVLRAGKAGKFRVV